MSTTLFTATADAATGDFRSNDIVTFVVQGTQVADEPIDIQIWNGAAFVDLYQKGIQVQLSSVNTAETIYGPGVFRIDKDATTNAITVEAFRSIDVG